MLGQYASRLQALIAAHKVYPALSLERGEEGTVLLRVTLAGDGALLNVRSVSDISSRLVGASLQALRASAPFPPLPVALGAASETFDVPLIYKIE